MHAITQVSASSETVKRTREEREPDPLPAETNDDAPARKRLAVVRARGVVDDAWQGARSWHRRQSAEAMVGETLLEALAAHPKLEPQLRRVEQALYTVPNRIGSKHVVEQVRAGGARALDHIEPLALLRREWDERNRLMGYVNRAATDARFAQFGDWVTHLDEKKIPRRYPKVQRPAGGSPLLPHALQRRSTSPNPPASPTPKTPIQAMDYPRAKDIYNELMELPAARSLADHCPDATVALGMDQLKQRDHRLATQRSFDLQVRGTHGDVRSHVEVTTVAREVTRPDDLARAIQHGIDKSQALPGGTPRGQTREVSIVVRWFDGNREAERGHVLHYLGDGSYEVIDRHACPIYKRHIIRDDLPHYLARHRDIADWLDRINILSETGDTCFHVTRRGRSWDIDSHTMASGAPDPDTLASRRLRQVLEAPLEGVFMPL